MGYILNYIQNIFTLAFVLETLIALAVLAAFLFVNRFLRGKIVAIVRKGLAKTKLTWGDTLLKAMDKPLGFLINAVGFYFFLVLFPLTSGFNIFWMNFLRSILIITLARIISFLADDFAGILLNSLKDKQANQTIRPLITRTLQVLAYALAILMIAQEWGYDVKGFIAGLGLVGFAVAMGAQDTITNMLSGLFLIADRSIAVGDWVSNDQVEGTVEEMSFRTTKIRTFEQSLITVPNSILANNPVTNYTQRGMRRIRFTLGVMYKTSAERLDAVIKRIENMLREHPRVVNDTIYVHFTTFNDSSLDILIYCFTDALNYGEFMKVKEEINFSIMDILEQESVSAAFPSTSLYIEDAPPIIGKLAE
ncbi:mechanosensitive ion channel family protein [Clostridia bacterium]|nr:mechanosensitive ion channel family protein [Clostridia bacterium]